MNPFSNFGIGEMLIILVIVLLLFGARRIPEIAGSLGKGITEFKRNLNDAQRAITEPPKNERAAGSGTPTDGALREGARQDEEVREPKRLLG